jgi:ferrous iron transport protein A
MDTYAASMTCVCPAAACGPHQSSPSTLMDLPVNTPAWIRGLRAGRHNENGDFAKRLLEIGFIAGEQVRVVAHGYPGREPIAVRIGGTTFALRRFEAELVLVERVNPVEAHA